MDPMLLVGRESALKISLIAHFMEDQTPLTNDK
jgi:hypothetical protein